MIPSCSFRYSGFLLANRRKGSTNSGRSATRDVECTVPFDDLPADAEVVGEYRLGVAPRWCDTPGVETGYDAS